MRCARHFSVEADGFHGSYFPCPGMKDARETNTGKADIGKPDKAFIEMFGDDTDDFLAKGGVKWLHAQGCSVMTMSPDKKDYGHHSYPLERIEAAVRFLQENGHSKIGIIGLSTTGMVALAAASLIPDITLTVALSPSDFVMEGFYQDNLDGMHERPGDGESTLTWRGEPLPYLPYAYRHPDYWKKIQADTKASGDMVVSRPMFDESEEKHPLQEAEKIKVENIHGHIIFGGAEDDVLWDTCKYIRRMVARLGEKEHACTFEAVTREHGTHFVLPEGMLKGMAPNWLVDFFVTYAFKEAKGFTKECRETRLELEHSISRAIARW